MFFIYLFSSVANHFNVLIFTKKINMIFHLGIKSSPKIILTGLAIDKTSVLDVIIYSFIKRRAKNDRYFVLRIKSNPHREGQKSHTD